MQRTLRIRTTLLFFCCFFWHSSTRKARKQQIMCDSWTAAVASVIWEQIGMGGTCQVQWEFQVKRVIFLPAINVFLCVELLRLSWLCVCQFWTSGHLFEVPRWIVPRQLQCFPRCVSERWRELDKQKIPLDLRCLPLRSSPPKASLFFFFMFALWDHQLYQL